MKKVTKIFDDSDMSEEDKRKRFVLDRLMFNYKKLEGVNYPGFEQMLYFANRIEKVFYSEEEIAATQESFDEDESPSDEDEYYGRLHSVGCEIADIIVEIMNTMDKYKLSTSDIREAFSDVAIDAPPNLNAEADIIPLNRDKE